jgi:hypothetical protein
MKLTAVILALSASAQSIEMQGDKVVLTDNDKVSLAACAKDGGCQVWTLEEIKQLVQEVANQVMCKRNSI